MAGLIGKIINKYQTLSDEQEKTYIASMLAGDKSARENLINSNLRLVLYFANKMSNYFNELKTSVSIDDIISVGTIGLIKGIDSFEPTKGVKLATYASRCISNEILMTYRSHKKHKNVTNLNDVISTDEDGIAITYMDILEQSNEPETEKIYDHLIIDNDIMPIIESRLSAMERKIILFRYFNTQRYTQRDVADQMNLSRSYISRIEKQAILKIQQSLQKTNGI